VFAIPSIELLENVDLRLRESRRQLRRRLGDRFEYELVLRRSGEQDSARGGQGGES
jgi:hypothetical protein